MSAFAPPGRSYDLAVAPVPLPSDGGRIIALDGVRVGQGGGDCHTHLGLQRGQHHRSGLLHVGDLNGQYLHRGRVVSAVGCLDRNYVGVAVVASSTLWALKVGGTLECEDPVLYVEVFIVSDVLQRPDDRLALRVHCRKGGHSTRVVLQV